MFLLDTHVISELRKPKADANVVAWAKTVIATRLFLSAITLEELETGVLRMERRDPMQGKVLDQANESDTLIAATALVHGLTLVTRNVSDFNPAAWR